MSNENKPGKWQRFKAWWRKGKSAEERPSAIQQRLLHEHGISVMGDGKHDQRMDMYEQLKAELTVPINTSSLSLYMKDLMGRFEKVHYAVCHIAGPYADSSGSRDFSVRFDGWMEWYGEWSDDLITIQEWVEEEIKDSKKDQKVSTVDLRFVVEAAHTCLAKFVFPDAFFLITFCFKNAHIFPASAVVIQTMMPPNKQ